MLIPRFSLRWSLGVVTALCFFLPIVAAAVRGQHWAVAIVIAAGAAVLMASLYALLFCTAWVFGLPFNRPQIRVESPFATDRLPPVVVSPPPDPFD